MASVSPEPSNLTSLHSTLSNVTAVTRNRGELKIQDTDSKITYTSQKIFQHIRDCKQTRLTTEEINTAIGIVQKTKDLFSKKAFRKSGIEKEADRLIADLTLLLPSTTQTSTTAQRTLQTWVQDLQKATMKKSCWSGRYVVIQNGRTKETLSAKQIHHLIQEIETAIKSGNLTDDLCETALVALVKIDELYQKTNSRFFKNTTNENYQKLQIAVQQLAETVLEQKLNDASTFSRLTTAHSLMSSSPNFAEDLIKIAFPNFANSSRQDALIKLITKAIQKHSTEVLKKLQTGTIETIQKQNGEIAKKTKDHYRTTGRVVDAHEIVILDGLETTVQFQRDIQNPPFPNQFSGINDEAQLEDQTREYKEELLKTFLTNLKNALGEERQHLSVEILKLLDQYFIAQFASGAIKPYLQSLVIESPDDSGSPSSFANIIPQTEREEFQIRITSDKVSVILISDYPAQQKILGARDKSYELAPNCETFATINSSNGTEYLDIKHPIRVVSEFIIGNTDDDMEFNITMQKLDSIAPLSTLYPIVDIET